jgi:hypothetical protein
MEFLLSRRLLGFTLLAFSLVNVVLWAALRPNEINPGLAWILVALVDVIGLGVSLMIGLKADHLAFGPASRRYRQARSLTGWHRT